MVKATLRSSFVSCIFCVFVVGVSLCYFDFASYCCRTIPLVSLAVRCLRCSMYFAFLFRCFSRKRLLEGLNATTVGKGVCFLVK